NILLEWARTARIGIAATGRLRLGCARSHLGMGARTLTVRTRQPVRAGRVDVRGRRSGRQGLVGAGRWQLLCARPAPHASVIVGSAVDGTAPGRSAPAEMVLLRRNAYSPDTVQEHSEAQVRASGASRCASSSQWAHS